ncbi:DapH/DapD/GlmU-related protein [Gordonia jacobaea]|uniref:DapH/DapD/GlmU-related protein n=1 Tax=Gordonia jacobaea TaxID=122202 RepID=UPI003D763488
MHGDTTLVREPRGASDIRDFVLSEFTGVGYDKGRSLPVQCLWLFARSIISQWWVPNKVRIAVMRMFGARIGDRVLIRHGVRVHWPWKLEVGDDTWIGEGAWILNLEPVRIGSNTCISQDVVLCTGSHDSRSRSFEFDNAPVIVGDGVWIALRATVLRGVTVGDRAVVGATALVVTDVKPGATVLAPLAVEANSNEVTA